jgi:uncharacterized membrane protein
MLAWIKDIVLLLTLLVVGLVCLFSPITAAKVFMLWPKFIFPKFFRKDDIRPIARDALRLIDEDPEEYTRRFWYQLLMFRISGVVALMMFAILLLMVIAYPPS